MTLPRMVVIGLTVGGVACGSNAGPKRAAPPLTVAPPPGSASASVSTRDTAGGAVVPFEIGATSFIPGDDIRIDQIRGDRPDFVVNGTYRVRGHYRLRSHPTARIAIHSTNGETRTDEKPLVVSAGEGTFDLHFTIGALGWPHVSFYPAGNGSSFGGVYFGAGETLHRANTPPSQTPCDLEPAKKLGWTLSGGGGSRGEYCAAPDDANARAGHATLRLAKRGAGRFDSYATLMKVVDPTPYLGKRVRVEVDVRTNGARGRRDFWGRVQAKSSPGDGAGLGGAWTTLAETADWERRAIVLDVPLNGAALEYGVGLQGGGEVWIDNDLVTVVDASVPLTNPPPATIDGWRLLGVGRADYVIASDATTKRGATIPILWKLAPAQATTPSKRYAALVRAVPALDLRGKRVKVTRWVRTKDAEEMSCIVKVQREPDWTYGAVLAIDFEKLPPTRDWYRCESVVDVGVEAGWILGGITGRGAGQAWVDEWSAVAVAPTTPLTQHSP